MRIFGRFLYALFAVGIFLLAFQFSIYQMRLEYYQDVFGESLEDEDSELPEFYYFYAAFPDFHKSEPVININQDGYQVRAYEIARTFIEDDQLRVEEYLFFLIYHQDLQKLEEVDILRLMNEDGGDYLNINLIRYQGLEILTSVNAETSMFLVSKEEMELANDYDLLQLKDSNDATIIESALTLGESDFTIKAELESFYNTYDELPTHETIHLLGDTNIQPKEEVVTTNNYLVDEYIYIMGLVMGAYFLILIISTYFIFFKKRKEKRKPYE